LVLSKPVALVRGDHFIIRSPEETLGGGKVVESHARRYHRFSPKIIRGIEDRARGSVEEVTIAILETRQPLESSALSAQVGLSVVELEPVVESLIEQGRVVAIGQGENRLLFTAGGWAHVTGEVTGTLRKYHQSFPSRAGMPQAELASRLKMGGHRQLILPELIRAGVIAGEGAMVRLPGHQVQLTPAQQGSIDAFLDSLNKHSYAPAADLIPEPDLLNLLVARRQVVKVASDVVFSASAYNEMVTRVTSRLKANGRVTVAEVRDMFQTSRRYAVALLEYLDGIKVTRRVGDERVLC
jgi:selenocysteine-specific elongation factor